MTQENVLLGTLTVRETLTYSAHLRLPSSMSKEEVTGIVEGTITEMGLQECGDRLIAFFVVGILKNVAHAGKTVVSAIHQPSSEVLLSLMICFCCLEVKLFILEKQNWLPRYVCDHDMDMTIFYMPAIKSSINLKLI